MRNKIISLFTVIVLTFSVCSVAMADNISPGTTRNEIKSSGAIVYQDGSDSVVIDADDLYALADKLDSFKAAVADQLATMHTYLTTSNKGVSLASDSSVNVVHAMSQDIAIVDPLLVDFDTLLEGFAASQSIPFSPEEYGYTSDTQFYKSIDGSITTDGTGEDVEQINLAAAVEDNLSAGCAAWVDGKLILGTGADNRAYYNLGYAKGLKESIDGAYISYTYHKHVNGNNEIVDKNTIYSGSNPGGCYISAGHTHNKTGTCPSKNEKTDNNHEHSVSGQHGDNIWCPHCGYCTTFDLGETSKSHHCEWHGDKIVYLCNSPTNTWKIGCGKTTNSIDSAVIIFP